MEGEGSDVFGYDRVLTELLALIGESVEVLIGTSGDEEAAYTSFRRHPDPG